MAQSPAIGIDLGTTRCCVAVLNKNGTINIINNTDGQSTTPSYVSFDETGVHFGETAEESSMKNILSTVFDVKRMIGRRHREVMAYTDRWPFEVIDEQSKIKIKLEHKGETITLFPEQLSAILLSYLKFIAEDYLDTDIKDVVITVPATFNKSQREATKIAAEIAGLNVLRFTNEPTAAALAYGMQKTSDQNILMYDLGGGTFDVSIIRMEKGNLTVKAVGGNSRLGGNDFTNNIVEWVVRNIKENHNICVKSDKKTMRRLFNICENTKKKLSNIKNILITIDKLKVCEKSIDFSQKFTRDIFDEINNDLFQSTIEIVEKCIRDAGLEKKDIGEVILVGGSSRIPKIKKNVENYFGKGKQKGKINPDEAVAMGAAILAARLQNISKSLAKNVVQDLTPLSLGILADKGNEKDQMFVIIPSNTHLPTKDSAIYCTSDDNQKSMNMSIYEGENRIANNNHLIDSFTLHDLTLALKGETKVKVTFELDVNDILTVSAKELNDNKNNEKKLTITRGTQWTEAEIDAIKEETKKYLYRPSL